jgi:hypothetical protein
MTWADLAITVAFGLFSVLSLAVSWWVWTLDRRTDPPAHGWRGRVHVATVPFANRGQVVLSLLFTDAFIAWVALQIPAAGAVAALTGAALVPLALLSFTTLRFGWPSFLVPPWARGRDRSPSQRSSPMAAPKAALTLAAGLGFVVVVLGLIWLIAVPEAVRLWGAVAMVAGIAMMIGVWRAQRP